MDTFEEGGRGKGLSLDRITLASTGDWYMMFPLNCSYSNNETSVYVCVCVCAPTARQDAAQPNPGVACSLASPIMLIFTRNRGSNHQSDRSNGQSNVLVLLHVACMGAERATHFFELIISPPGHFHYISFHNHPLPISSPVNRVLDTISRPYDFIWFNLIIFGVSLFFMGMRHINY